MKQDDGTEKDAERKRKEQDMGETGGALKKMQMPLAEKGIH